MIREDHCIIGDCDGYVRWWGHVSRGQMGDNKYVWGQMWDNIFIW